MQAGRMQLVQSNASVYVRVCDAQRMGSLEGAANEGQAENLLYRPSYVQEGSRLQRDMRLVKSGGRTYDNARYHLCPVAAVFGEVHVCNRVTKLQDTFQQASQVRILLMLYGRYWQTVKWARYRVVHGFFQCMQELSIWWSATTLATLLTLIAVLLL